MPFWPWYMAACVALMVYGYGRGGWHIPALILCGLIGMRFVAMLHAPFFELAAFPLWLCIASLLMYKGAWVPGVLCLLSGATYPTLLVLGARIEYLGISPILADAFLISAIFAGWWGMGQRGDSHDYCSGLADHRVNIAVGMAAREARHVGGAWGVSEVKASLK